MTAPAAEIELTAPGFCHHLPVHPLPDDGSGYEVTWLNGQAQIIVPVGREANGQMVALIFTDLHALDQLVYRVMLAQARLAQAAVTPACAA